MIDCYIREVCLEFNIFNRNDMIKVTFSNCFVDVIRFYRVNLDRKEVNIYLGFLMY